MTARKYTDRFVRQVSVKVYRARLVAESGQGAPDRMIARDDDCGMKLMNRAGSYDALTRCYLEALEFEPQ
jgi:hypothetical protein